MANMNRDPRTNVNVNDTGRRSGSSALWLILGAVLVALAVYFFVFAGTDVADDAVVDPVGVVDEEAEPIIDGAVAPVEGAATTVETTVDEAVEDTAEAVEGTAEAVDDPATIVDDAAETEVEEVEDEETGTTTTITTTVPAD